MAERTVAVKLTARVDQYVAAMKSAESASGQFSAQTQSNLRQVGGSMQRVGGTLTRSVTLPLVVAGAGALKLGLDFDTAFSRMVGLAGVSADAVDGMKESVLGLAGETGQAPVDLANALYEAASAGLDSEQALAAVEVAAKGAASGMGSAADITGLIASATASYGAANIDASEAVDILTQTIREGRADPQELAGTLGRILPIAAQMGVTFAEVGGIVAYTTNAFGDTDRAVTGVNDTLAKLSAPGALAKQALLDMGTSAEELQTTIREDGLLAGLDLLRERGFAGNADAIRALMPDMQGAATLTLLLNDASGTLTETLDATANSTGAAGEAFATMAQTDMFKLKVAWSELQVALIAASDAIIPMVTGVATAVGDLASAFTSLPAPVQSAVIGLLAVVAAIGPMMSIGGKVVANLGAISTGLQKVGLSATSASVTLGIVGVVLMSAGAIYASYASEKAEAKAMTDEFVTALQAEASGQRDATMAAIAARLANADMADAIKAAGLSVQDVARVIRGESVPAVQQFLDVQGRFGDSSRVMQSRMEDLGVTYTASTGQAGLLARTIDELAGAHGAAVVFVKNQADAEKALGVTTDTTAAATEDQTGKLWDFSDALFGNTGAIEDTTTATEDHTGATEDDTVAVDAGKAALERATAQYDRQKESTEAAREAIQRLTDEIMRATGEVFSHEQATLQLDNAYYALQVSTMETTAAIRDGTLKGGEAETAFRDLRLEELQLAGQAYSTAEAFAAQEQANGNASSKADLMKWRLGELAGQFPGLRDEIQAYIDKLNAIPATKNTTVSTNFVTNNTGGTGPAARGVTAVAEGIVVDRPMNLFAGEAGMEVVLPLTNAARMRELVGDPRVFGPLMSALGASSGGGSPSSTPIGSRHEWNVKIDAGVPIEAAVERIINRARWHMQVAGL